MNFNFVNGKPYVEYVEYLKLQQKLSEAKAQIHQYMIDELKKSRHPMAKMVVMKGGKAI